MRYSDLLSRLFKMNNSTAAKSGLSNILKLSRELDFPEKKFSSVHVAGTNGKGSVSTKIASAMQHAGLRVGLYTSPHISSFRERIKIDDVMISEDAVTSLLEKIFAIIKKDEIQATFFEITTMLAFAYFAEENIDVAVLETGLGGRFDATNIVIPKLSVITSIHFDHTEILGNSLEEIAREKAGIIKPFIPIVIGPRVPIQCIEEIAMINSSPLEVVEEAFDSFEDENCAISKRALKLLKIPEKAIHEGLKARPPCRMEIVLSQQIPVILDVGHNPDGLEHLFKAVREKYPTQSLRILFALSKTKDIQGCLDILKRHGSHFHLVEGPDGRNVDVNDLYKQMLAMNTSADAIFIDSSITESVKHSLRRGFEQNQILIICGSFYIMKEARAALGIKEATDFQN